MKILITNDDGIHSPGIRSLKKILSEKHEVWLLAPDGDRSGYSQSITLREPVKIKKLEDRVYSCSGTPVDCVAYGYRGYLQDDFDLLLSGINIGPNLGTDLLYSGTAAAARQGALKHLPSIALSLNKFEPPYDFDTISAYLMERLEYLVSLWDESCFLNMNFPAEMAPDTDLLWCRPAFRDYRDKVVQVPAPRDENSTYCFLKGNLVQSEDEEGTDVQAVHSGQAAISAVRVAPSIVSHIGNVPEKAGNCSR